MIDDFGDYKKLKTSLDASWGALKRAKERVKAIGKILPDVLDSDQRAKLKSERTALQSEIQGAPEEIGELARRVALAHLSEFVRLESEWLAERDLLQEKIDQLNSELRVKAAAKSDHFRQRPTGASGGYGFRTEAEIESVLLLQKAHDQKTVELASEMWPD